MSHDLVKPNCKKNVAFDALLALSMLFSGSARTSDVTVDCPGAAAGAFTSISAALETLNRQGPHIIFLLPSVPFDFFTRLPSPPYLYVTPPATLMLF